MYVGLPILIMVDNDQEPAINIKLLGNFIIVGDEWERFNETYGEPTERCPIGHEPSVGSYKNAKEMFAEIKTELRDEKIDQLETQMKTMQDEINKLNNKIDGTKCCHSNGILFSTCLLCGKFIK